MKTFQEFSRIKIFDGAELHEAPVLGSSGDFNSFWLEETLTLIKIHTMEIRHYEPSSHMRVIWCVGASDQAGEPLFEYDIVQYQRHSYVVGYDEAELGFCLGTYTELGELVAVKRLTQEVASQTTKLGNWLVDRALLVRG